MRKSYAGMIWWREQIAFAKEQQDRLKKWRLELAPGSKEYLACSRLIEEIDTFAQAIGGERLNKPVRQHTAGGGR